MSKPGIARTLSIRVTNQLSTPPETTACQKLMILWATGVFIALASLTASLPFNRKSEQFHDSAADVPAGAIDNGDTAWIVVATIFGTLLTPAVAYLYSKFPLLPSRILVILNMF